MSLIISRGFGGSGGTGPGVVITQGYGDQATSEGASVSQAGSKVLRYQRGIGFANVPRGKSDLVVKEDSEHQFYTNSVQPIVNRPGDQLSSSGVYSGAVKFRFRNNRSFPVPSKVKNDSRYLDQFGNPIFPFTGG